MSRSCTIFVLLVLVAGIQLAKADEELAPPNIVFILADDLGYADTGATGSRSIRTPSIDRIATEGVTITNAYASSPICSPTRTALLTGQYAQRFRVGLDEPLRSSDARRFDLGLPQGQPTLASILADRGYETALVGKWHQGLPPENGPLKFGYERFFGIFQGAADYFLHTMVKDGESTSLGLFDGSEEVRRSGYITDLLGDAAVDRIRGRSNRPLFLSVHFTAPHWPWEGRGDEAIARNLSLTQHYDGGTLETYKEMVEALDDNVGKILLALDAAGIADNSIVIFTSDNGGERFSDNWPFSGVKGEVLEGGIRVPLFVRWPAEIEPRTSSRQVVTTMDFLPTLLAATGSSREGLEVDGENVLPQLTGAPPTERTMFWRFKASGQGAVRQGDWKYLRIGDKEHLFNVSVDPRERAMLEKVNPDKFEELKRLFLDWNSEMLPYPDESYSEAVENSYPDRY